MDLCTFHCRNSLHVELHIQTLIRCDWIRDNCIYIFYSFSSLVNCSISKVSCDILASTLKSNLSHLTTLYCGGNNLTESDVKQLSDIKKSPHYKLKTLRSVDICSHSELLSAGKKAS